jgi:hypothetical protein
MGWVEGGVAGLGGGSAWAGEKLKEGTGRVVGRDKDTRAFSIMVQ